MMSFKVGVIGVGTMGENHCRVLSTLIKEGWDVLFGGIFDIDLDKAKKIADRYNTHSFSDHQSLLEMIDAVCIATPTTTHEFYVMQAISKGVHCLVEKPISDTIQSAMRMATNAEKAGIILCVGHLERLNPVVITLKDYVMNGELGDVVSISTKRVGPHNPRIRDIGVILDLGIHDIDVCSFVMGSKIERVCAMSGKKIHNFDDYASILLGFPQNRIGTCTINWLTPKKIRTISVVGTGGVVEADYLKQSAIFYRDGFGEEIKIEKKEPLRSELESFILACTKGMSIPVPAYEAIESLKVAIAAMESAKQGKIIEIEKNWGKEI